MKALVAIVALAGILIFAGCSTSDSKPADTGKAGPPALQPSAPDANAAVVPPANTQGGQEWDTLIQRLKQQQEVSEQQKAAQADEHYRLAERYYQTGDFDRAELECEKALQLQPNHAAAKALYLEVQFVQGRERATPLSKLVDDYLRKAQVQHSQTLIEIDDKLSNGVRAYNAGYYDQAEENFRTVLEYAKWLPTGPDLETRRKQAADYLEKTKAARRQKEIDEQRVRLQMIEEEKARDEVRKKIEQKRELELLFGKAQMAFEREDYLTCIQICERILYRNPTLRSVEEMKMVSQRLSHQKAERDNLRNYIEEWKRTFENIELTGIVQAEELSFPARELWQEVISKRQPKGIQDFELDALRPEDQEIVEKLKSIRITIDMQNAGLNAVVDYIREISGLNFVIDNKAIENPEQEVISIKVNDIILDGALKLMLNPKNKAHVVEGGVVIVTSTDALKKKVRLELYDVQDLTYGLQDFPGVDISLAQDAIGTTATAEEGAKQQFTGDDLANLIKNTIEKDNWEEADGKSITFNNGLLIVRNTVSVHKSIQKFLSDLRASTGILVAVEARFLTVEEDFLQQVGMDFRDVDGTRVVGIANLDDINPAFATLPGNQFATFLDPDGAGGPLSATSAGITGTFGNAIQRPMGMRVQQIMTNDFLFGRFTSQVLGPVGGATLQYTLLDDISLEAIVRLVSRDQRQHMLTAPKLVLFNTQRGNIRISNQFAYIRDYDIQIATAAVAPDPQPDVVSDGITLDVRPIVSADRRYVTVEMRPTVATLFPPPPQVFGISINLAGPIGAPVTAGTVFIETPILNIQRLRTTVVVPDRGTLLLGGLTTLFDIDAESSIPVWRNIPILGNLGSNKFKGLQRRQLLTILRTRIIIPDEEERRRFD
jgi:type II secretory pathway component GspD/PulD (secretin)